VPNVWNSQWPKTNSEDLGASIIYRRQFLSKTCGPPAAKRLARERWSHGAPPEDRSEIPLRVAINSWGLEWGKQPTVVEICSYAFLPKNLVHNILYDFMGSKESFQKVPTVSTVII
jgi:hypothetical protein